MKLFLINLSMGVDDGAEEFPGASVTIHAHHAENLEKAETAECGCGENLAAAAQRDNNDAGNDRHDI